MRASESVPVFVSAPQQIKKMEHKHAAALTQADGKVKNLQTKLGAVQRENMELLEALAAAKEDRFHHQGDLLALQKSFDARLSELSAKVFSNDGGGSALDGAAIDTFGEILNEEAQVSDVYTFSLVPLLGTVGTSCLC